MSSKNGKIPPVHLYQQPRITKERGLVKNYSMAVSYREEGKNLKKVLLGLGQLSDRQADACRTVLKLWNQVIRGEASPDSLVPLRNIELGARKRFLDCAVVVALWNFLDLAKILPTVARESESLSTANVALILVANRILAPASKVQTVEWFQSTMLGELLKISNQGKYNSSKIFRELAKIHICKGKFERLFSTFSQNERNRLGVSNVYYFDGTTTWFEGRRCRLAVMGKEKTRGHFDKTLGFMMMTDNLGYPIAWEVVSGNVRDTTCFLSFAERVRHDFGISELTFCFDRGVASDANFKGVDDLHEVAEKEKFHFISGLRDDQIRSYFDLKSFAEKVRDFLIKEAERNRLKKSTSSNEKQKRKRQFSVGGFIKYSDRVFYKDLGHKGEGYRHIICFNADIFDVESAKINQSVDNTLKAVHELNLELAIAKRDREHPEIKLREIFAKLKTSKFFDYQATPIASYYRAQTFEIKLSLNKEAIESARFTAGMMLFVTNHKAETNKIYKLSAAEIIGHYKAKNVIENSFRELKSFLNLRPVHVWTEEHVRAHFDIATVGYFINNYVYQQLKDTDVSLRDFYSMLEASCMAMEIKSPQGTTSLKVETPSASLQKCFDRLGIASGVSSLVQAATAT